MKRIIAKGILLSCITLIIFSVKAQEPAGIKYGKCYKAIELIQETLKNDSLAVAWFWTNYKILSDYPQSLKKKSPAEVIIYFKKEENKDLMCVHKRFANDDKVLLDTTGTRGD
ncbi:hypothetical protein [Prolixibacter sp. SD074]|uniref:hypothetical protein n=1 Tax=Prolixibacter sp. SD074 TaxID=2652391 RepID=UPI00126E9D58|nr:hypothetical protein [Prolixibacter sp. SD074]GET30045.1 hypothetical protein SD074_22470 [Prolixibacter sp. SD074]